MHVHARPLPPLQPRLERALRRGALRWLGRRAPSLFPVPRRPRVSRPGILRGDYPRRRHRRRPRGRAPRADRRLAAPGASAVPSANVHLTTLAEALTIRERVFVKPTDEKCFPARVYGDGTPIAPDPGLPPDLPVLVSEPVVFEVEYRFFVLEREVAALSPYIRGGEVARSEAGEWEADARENRGCDHGDPRDPRRCRGRTAACGGRRRGADGGARLGRGRGQPGLGLGALRLRPGERPARTAPDDRGAQHDLGSGRALGTSRRLSPGQRGSHAQRRGSHVEQRGSNAQPLVSHAEQPISPAHPPVSKPILPCRMPIRSSRLPRSAARTPISRARRRSTACEEASHADGAESPTGEAGRSRAKPVARVRRSFARRRRRSPAGKDGRSQGKTVVRRQRSFALR